MCGHACFAATILRGVFQACSCLAAAVYLSFSAVSFCFRLSLLLSSWINGCSGPHSGQRRGGL